MHDYDIVIVGAGPAGISAGIYAVSRGLKTLVLERESVGGIIGSVSTVTHYAGMPEAESGAAFARRLQDQAIAAGVDIAYQQVRRVALADEIKTISTGTDVYRAPRIVLANGGTPRVLDVPGEVELTGKGCGLNAARDGAAYRGKSVYVIGGADGAVKEALFLARFAHRVRIVCVERELACVDEFRRKVAATPAIEVIPFTAVGALHGADRVGGDRPRIARRRQHAHNRRSRLRSVRIRGLRPQHPALRGPAGTARRVHPHERAHGNRAARRVRRRRHSREAGAAGGHRRS